MAHDLGSYWMPVNNRQGELSSLLRINPDAEQFELRDLGTFESQRGPIVNSAWTISRNSNFVAISDGRRGITGELAGSSGNHYGTFKITAQGAVLDLKQLNTQWQCKYKSPILAYHHPSRPCDIFVVNLRDN